MKRLWRFAAAAALCMLLLPALPLAVGATEAPNWPDECPLCGGSCQYQTLSQDSSIDMMVIHIYDSDTGTVYQMEEPMPDEWVPTDENKTTNENTGGGNIPAQQHDAVDPAPAPVAQAAAAGSQAGKTAGQAGQAQTSSAAKGGLEELMAEGKGALGHVGAYIAEGRLLGVRVSVILTVAGALMVLYILLSVIIKSARRRRRRKRADEKRQDEA